MVVIVSGQTRRIRVRSVTLNRGNDNGPEIVEARFVVRLRIHSAYSMVKNSSMGVSFQSLFLEPGDTLRLLWEVTDPVIALSADSIMCEEVSQEASNAYHVWSCGVASYAWNASSIFPTSSGYNVSGMISDPLYGLVGSFIVAPTAVPFSSLPRQTRHLCPECETWTDEQYDQQGKLSQLCRKCLDHPEINKRIKGVVDRLE